MISRRCAEQSDKLCHFVFNGTVTPLLHVSRRIPKREHSHLLSNVLCAHAKWVPVTTAWLLLRWRMEEWPRIWE